MNNEFDRFKNTEKEKYDLYFFILFSDETYTDIHNVLA